MFTASYIMLSIVLAAFILGIITCLTKDSIEGFQNFVHNGNNKETNLEGKYNTCPDMLIGTDNGILLLNTSEPRGPNNPIRFNNLDEYIKFTETLKQNGQSCPILYLQQESNAQGEDVYRVRPSPFSMDGGMPSVPVNPVSVIDASRDNPPYNQNMYAGFDPYGQDVGVYNELDKVHDSTQNDAISDNPMDPNWGGVTFSQEAVLSGKYADRVVGKPTMIPKVL